MVSYYQMVKAISTVGLLVSIVLCFFILPVGIIAAVVNLIAINSADKQIKKLEDKKNK